MRPRPRTPDWGLLLVLCYALLMCWTFLVRPGLPRQTDALVTVYRSQEVANAVREGVLYPRWAGGFLYTYGSPIFNYLPPLSHLLPGYHQALTDVPAVDSIRLTFVISIIAAGIGMYLFSRQRFGAAAGVLGAIALLTSTPVAYTLPHIVGDLGGLMALSALPWALWSMDRVVSLPRNRGNLMILVVSLCIMLLSDPRIAILTVPLFMLSAITAANDLTDVWRAFAVIILSVGLTAFYWLPAYTESVRVQWQRVTIDSRAGAIPLTESLSLTPPHDLRMVNPLTHRSIGVGVWVLALVGAAVCVWIRRTDGLFFAAFGVMFVGIASLEPSSAPTFFPLLPYHFLLVAMVSFVIAGSSAAQFMAQIVAQSTTRRRRVLLIIALCIIPIMGSIPVWFPPDWRSGDELFDPLLSLEDELQGYHAAGLRDGLLLPIGLNDPPPPQTDTIGRARARELERVNTQTFAAADARIQTVQSGVSALFNVTAARPVQPEFYFLWDLNWSGTLGSRTLPIGRSQRGLVTVSLPVSDNTQLTLWQESTPTRDVSWIVSGGTVLVLLFVLRGRDVEDYVPPPPLARSEAVTLALVLAVVSVLMLVVRTYPAVIYPGDGSPYRGMSPLPRFLQGGIDLLGYSAVREAKPSDDLLTVTLYWQAARPILENNQSELYVVNADGVPIIRSAHRHPGGLQTVRWSFRQYVRDTFTITLPETLPPGEYGLRVVIGACNTYMLSPCDVITGMDAFDSFGNAERGGITLPYTITIP
jgi:hypothetical protein